MKVSLFLPVVRHWRFVTCHLPLATGVGGLQ